MKAIMMSIRPEWVAKILNKEKTIEVRKHFPSDYVGWVYIYATKKYDECLWYKKDSKCYVLNYGKPTNDYLNGKVVARFWCDKVDYYEDVCFWSEENEKASCLTPTDFFCYSNNKPCYLVHITKLEIFDKPKEISEFKTKLHIKGGCKNCPQNTGLSMPYCKTCDFILSLTRVPQSWQFIEI